MATSLSRKLALGSLFLTCLIAFALVANTGWSTAQEGLPPVRQLIADTLIRCNADRENNTSALSDLAAAQCYLGEFAAARKTIVPYAPDDIFLQAAHQLCAQIEIEFTGSTSSVPELLWKDELGFMHCDAALAFIERGELDKALHHLEAIPKSVYSPFSMFGVKLAQKLKDEKQDGACRKLLLIWASCYEQTRSIFDYRDSHHIPQLVAWLVEFDERPTATSLCERWHSILQAETDIDECGERIGRTWAEFARAQAALGEKDAARHSLKNAREWIDKALSVKADPNHRLTHFDFAKSYAAIAARQAMILGDEESRDAYDQAYQLARLSVNPQYGEYAFEQIVAEQFKAGDEKGTRETIKRMLTPKYIAKSWASICEHELALGKIDSARAAARSASQWLDQDGFEPFMAHDMARVAATAALAGEKELAQKLFARALGLSEANEENKFDHSWIASRQIHAGLFVDGYRTIQSLPDPADQLRTLAQLCRALAKAEYLANKAKRAQNP